MAFQFVFGGSGSGKTHYLYQRIIKEAGENPALNYIVLVPEQFTMQTQKDLVLMHEKKGIMNIDVLSFGRLAHRVFEETGKGGRPVLDDEGKNLILRKIAGNLESELKVLRGNIKRPGYISEVKSILSEFDQYDIGSGEICQVMEGVKKDSYLYYKLQDIQTLHEGFRRYLQDRYITKEELLDVLCRVAGESRLLKQSVLVLDGFTGFTPVQNRLLGELMELCRDVVVTVTIDSRENPYVYQNPWQMFAMSRHTAVTLTRTAAARGVEQKEPVWLKERPCYRFRNNKALGFLEENLFRYSGKQYEGSQQEIALFQAANPRGEAFAAAAQVRRLVRKEGLRYREVGVIVTDMAGYGDYLEQAFSRYGIPVFMDYKRSILLNSFVEYVRSILAMAEEHFTYDSVLRFLRAGYGPFSEEETDELDNYCLALGIRGYRNWQRRWTRKTADMTEEDLERMNHLRVEFIELTDSLMFVLRQRKKTVRDITEALYRFLERGQLQRKVQKQEEELTAAGKLALAREYGQVYGAVIQLFDKFVELLGDEEVGLREYGQLLDAGLNEAKIGVAPPGFDEVIVGDVERTRLKDIRALLVLGVNDSLLPGSLFRGGLLSERDREKFEQEGLKLTPGSREQAYIQKFYLYLNLTKPEKYLYLYYSRTSSEGKALRPAYLISEIRRLFPEISVCDETRRTLRERELTPETGVAELIRGFGMQAEDDAEAWMELYSWYRKRPEWTEKMEQILDAWFDSYQPGQISEAAAKLLYGEKFQGSISRLESFSSCAYCHFLSYGLRLKEREEFAFQALDLGNVFHAAMERYSGKAERAGGWTVPGEGLRREMVRESVEEAVSDYGNSILYSSARNEYMIVRITRLLDRTVWALTDQLAKGDFVPEAYEITIGSGKIDRIDLCEDRDEVYVKVLDYKTGQTGFDLSALCYGLQLQLMVYMNAAVGRAKKRYPDKQVIPAGVFYYRMKDPLVDKGSGKEIHQEILKQLRLDGIVNLEKDSLVHLDRQAKGESTAVPVKWNKDGSLAKTSRAVGKEDFHTMLSFADRKRQDISEAIRRGEIQARPYRYGQKTGCDYCAYRHICGFDLRIPGYQYANLSKLSREEAVARMKQALADRGRGEEE